MKRLIILSILFSFCLSTQTAMSQENIGNYEQWLKLHDLYVEALKKKNPNFKEPQKRPGRTEFEQLQKDASLREHYLDLMNEVEEYCAENKTLSECSELAKAVEVNQLDMCLGGFEYKFVNESVDQLEGDLAQILLASYKKGTSAQDFKNYSNSKAVANMIGRLRTNLTKNCTASSCKGSRKPGSKGKCFRYVKWGWMGGGFTKTYPGTRHARDAGGDLKRMGFRNLLSDSKYKTLTARDAPKGAVLVYSGGPSGHVEVKAGESEYLSDFKSHRPVSEYLPRKLIGIYVK